MSYDVTVLIPTRKRAYKLARTLDTIKSFNGTSIKTVIVVDGEIASYEALGLLSRQNTQFYRLRGHNGSVMARNYGAQFVAGHLLYATDDVDFIDGSIDKAVKLVKKKFQGDGVIGFWQDFEHHKSGVGLIGAEFLKRYPRKQFLYPGYFHFSSQEITAMADKLMRFYYAESECKIHHETPFRDPGLMDASHEDAREHRATDHMLMDARKEKGLIWGA